MNTNIDYQMNIPRRDKGEFKAPLYKCWGYVNENQTPLEIQPIHGKVDDTLFGIIELLGDYAQLLTIPYEESGETWGIWSIGENRLSNTKMGIWCDDYFCVGDFYDVDDSYDKDVTYTVTYLCKWMISRNVYNKLIVYLNK